MPRSSGSATRSTSRGIAARDRRRAPRSRHRGADPDLRGQELRPRAGAAGRPSRGRAAASVRGRLLDGRRRANVPADDFAEPYEIAAAAGLGCTVHAGEWAGPQSVRAALSCRSRGLDHGVRAIEEPALVREIAERGITLDTCPTSNVVLGVYGYYAQHPLPTLRDAGVRVTLGSDDPPYFGASSAASTRSAPSRSGSATRRCGRSQRPRSTPPSATPGCGHNCGRGCRTRPRRTRPRRTRNGEGPRHRQRRPPRRSARAVLRDRGDEAGVWTCSRRAVDAPSSARSATSSAFVLDRWRHGVIHAATLHKPHVASHRAPGFVEHEPRWHAELARRGGRGWRGASSTRARPAPSAAR